MIVNRVCDRLATVAALRFLLASIAAVVMLASAVVPAHAHDRLIDANPADGTQVQQDDAGVLTLNFSSEPLDLGNEVIVTDSTGATMFEGAPRIEGNSAIVELSSAPALGTMTVVWRIVSSDGHPITGELTYEIVESPKPAPSPEPSESATPTQSEPSESQASQSEESASQSPGESPRPTQSASELAAENSSNWMLWLLIALGALIAVGAGIYIATRKDKDETPAH